jgi:hypothetical protein
MSTSERLIDLEERQTLLAHALEELAPILARINAELIRNSTLSQHDGLTNQDAIASAAAVAAEARRQAAPRKPRTAAGAENGALIGT